MKKYIEIEIPMVPNFLRIKNSKHTVSVSSFSDKELKAVAKAWSEKLLARAAVIQKQQTEQN